MRLSNSLCIQIASENIYYIAREMSYLATVSNSLAKPRKPNIVTEPRVESRSIAVQSIGQQLSSPRSRSLVDVMAI